jgi:hypothetical protein
MLPVWLRWDEDAGKRVIIAERADVIRRIFEKADEGWGVALNCAVAERKQHSDVGRHEGKPALTYLRATS